MPEEIRAMTEEEFKKWIVEKLKLSKKTAREIIKIGELPENARKMLQKIWEREWHQDRSRTPELIALSKGIVISMIYALMVKTVPPEERVSMLEQIIALFSKEHKEPEDNHNIMFGA